MLDQSLLVAIVGGTGGLATIGLLLFRHRRRETVRKDQIQCPTPSPTNTDENLAPRSKTCAYSQVNCTEEEIGRAREELKRLTLERDIVTAGMKSIYEAEATGAISATTRNEMLEKYKVDLRMLDEEISRRKRVTELHDLETEHEQLTMRLREVGERLKQMKTTGNDTPPTNKDEKNLPFQVERSQKSDNPADMEHEERVNTRLKTEERIEAIRAEVLQAIERLERIEAES